MSRQKLPHLDGHPSDTLGTAGLKAYDFAQSHGRNLAIGAGVLVALVLGFVLLESNRTSSSQAADSQLALAISDVNTNQTDAAAQKLTDVVSRHGGSSAGNRARLYLGDIELKRGNAAAALTHYDAYLAKVSKGDYFWTTGQRGRAIALENQSRFADAAMAFEALAGGNMGEEERARALLDAAQARLRAADNTAALTMYDRILKEYPLSRATAAARLGKAELSAGS